MSEYLIQSETLASIADAIREKKGTANLIPVTELANEIASIETGGGAGESKLALLVGTQDATNNPYEITANDLEGVTEISQYAFAYKTGLTRVDLPDVTVLRQYAFDHCSNLETINLPNVETVARYSLGYCTKLTEIDLPNVTQIDGYWCADSSNLETINLPKLTSIPQYGIQYKRKMTTLNIPNVTSIGNSGLSDNSALTSLYLPKVTSIGNSVFTGCTALTSLTIPATCTKIGSYALQCGSSSNKCTFTFEGFTPPSIQSNTFNASYIYQIIVPAGRGEVYRNATNWANFAGYIVEKELTDIK